MLLLYKTRSFLSKKSILSRVRKELTDITKAPFNNAGWETLRERTARVWHELCH
jgi:hypothetical protein